MAEEGGGEDVTVPVLPALPPPMDVPPSPEPAAAAAQDAQDTSATTTTTAALNALAAAGTATAAAAAAVPVPTTPPPGRFFAVSSGSTEGEASQDWTIFGSWDAARRYLESQDVNVAPAASPAGTAGGTAADAPGVPAGCRQYRGFDDIMSAVLFASHGTVPMSAVIKPGAAASVAVASTAAASAPPARGKGSGRPRGRPRKNTGSTATTSTDAASAPAASATTATAASAAAAPAADPQATSENAAPAPGTAGTTTPAPASGTTATTRKRRPNKRWEKNYEILSSIRRRTGTFDVHSEDEEVVALSQKAAAASASASTAGGIEEGTPTPKKKPKRTQAEKLRRWVADQRKEYLLHSQGQKSAMTVDKLVRLGRLGFDFGGTGAGTASSAELPPAAAAGAAQSTGTGAASAAAAAVSTVASKSNLNKFGNEKHIRKKKRTLTPAKQREADEEWRRMFHQLLAFKEREGHCHVPATRRDDLSKWVSKQRYEYKLLREGSGISNLTTTQLLELQDAGFVFAPRKGAYITWEERVDQLREYRNRHGHVRVPTSDKQLGSFVRSQRVAYRKRNAGKTTSLTDERMEQLLELGFEFEVESGGSKKRKKQSPTVTMVSQNDYYY